MASMVLLDSNSNMVRRLGSVVSLSPQFVLPDGWYVSWEHQFLEPKIDRLEDAVLTHGNARILVTRVLSSIVVRIESPVVKDMMESIELVVQYAGGKVGAFDLAPHMNSFVGGVWNDLQLLYQKIRLAITSLRQRIGFMIAR